MTSLEILYHQAWNSPVGKLHILATDKHLKFLEFSSGLQKFQEKLLKKEVLIANKSNKITDATIEQLKQYFKGELENFDIPLDPEGTLFQKLAWKALRKIPYGKTVSYQGQAQKIKKPKAQRAVGSANGANPIAIVIPCHRVISSDGTLGGYGGGLDIKKKLLDLESSKS
jgi:O-6-methylguanine DNA methyltransferase